MSYKEVLKDNCSSVKKTQEEISNLLWSRLFFLLIKTISIFQKVPGSNLFELITLADMMQVVQGVSSSCSALKEAVGSDRLSDDNAASIMQVALDRVGQILQVTLATGAFRCCLGYITFLNIYIYYIFNIFKVWHPKFIYNNNLLLVVDLQSIFDILPQSR